MPRLSATVLQSSEQHTNALGERELILRGLSIPAVEHLAATLDQYDALDLSDNNLVLLENFPKLKRLSSLLCSDNAIEGCDGSNLGKNVPELRSLVLTGNRIGRLDEVRKLGEHCTKLEFLTLLGNPVTRRQHYRLYTIHKIPSLKVLDFAKVKDDERARAGRLASSAAGAALEGDVRLEAREASLAKAEGMTASSSSGAGAAKTFEPGGGSSAAEAFVSNFSREQKDRIRTMVAEAGSPEEIERIEASVRRGIFPGGDDAAAAAEGGEATGKKGKPPSPPHLTEDGVGGRLHARKRAASVEEPDESEGKKSRTAD